MMLGTDSDAVSLCLDAHWIFRGAGNSSVALFDIVELYGDRISEFHIRQSKQGVWSETFGVGDINYQKLVEKIRLRGIKPHLVLEQAIEKGSERSLSPVEAHRQSTQTARKIFAPFG